MSVPATRQELIDYCLRSLGYPVIEINVADSQLSDRIDDAVQYWQEFHGDGFVETYLKHVVTSTDIANGWIPITDEVLYVTGVTPIGQLTAMGDNIMFSVDYQAHLNGLFNLSYQGNFSEVVQMKQYMSLIDDVMKSKDRVHYSRWEQKLVIDTDWSKIAEGTYIIVQCYVRINPETVPKAWNDRWLKQYATAIIQRQWGQILSKFGGVVMLGGVTMDGEGILGDADRQIEKLEEQLTQRYQQPIDFFVA